MAQRRSRRGGGRGSARPTPVRRADGRRSAGSRSERTRTDARRSEPLADTDDLLADVAETTEAAPRPIVASDDGPRRRVVAGLSPKRAVLLAMVVSVVALTLAVPLRTYFAQQSEADQLAGANTALRGQVSEYQAKVDEQSDPAYIEAQARDRLQFVMPGDKAVVMQFPTPPAKSDEEQRAERRARNDWYTNLLDSVSTPVEK